MGLGRRRIRQRIPARSRRATPPNTPSNTRQTRAVAPSVASADGTSRRSLAAAGGAGVAAGDGVGDGVIGGEVGVGDGVGAGGVGVPAGLGVPVGAGAAICTGVDAGVAAGEGVDAGAVATIGAGIGTLGGVVVGDGETVGSVAVSNSAVSLASLDVASACGVGIGVAAGVDVGATTALSSLPSEGVGPRSSCCGSCVAKSVTVVDCGVVVGTRDVSSARAAWSGTAASWASNPPRSADSTSAKSMTATDVAAPYAQVGSFMRWGAGAVYGASPRVKTRRGLSIGTRLRRPTVCLRELSSSRQMEQTSRCRSTFRRSSRDRRASWYSDSASIFMCCLFLLKIHMILLLIMTKLAGQKFPVPLQEIPHLGAATGEAGLHGAQRVTHYLRGFFIRVTLNVHQHHGYPPVRR